MKFFFKICLFITLFLLRWTGLSLHAQAGQKNLITNSKHIITDTIFTKQHKFVIGSNHDTIEATAFINGKQQTSFYEGGKIRAIYTFRNGQKNGTYQLYHNNGTIKETGNLKNELQIGNKKVFDTNGELRSEEQYIIIKNPELEQNKKESSRTVPDKIVVLHGKATYNYPGQYLFQDFEFRYGKKDGVCKEYFDKEKSKLKSEIVFKNGLEHGYFARYNSNGILTSKGHFYVSLKIKDSVYTNVYDGTIAYYQENGKKSRVENWQNFKRNGLFESYHYNTGALSSRSFYGDDLLSGTEIHYDTDGNKKMEAFYEIVVVDGKKTSQKVGTESEWQNGRLLQTKEWKNGKLNGYLRSYYSDGNLNYIQIWINGVLQGQKTYYSNGIIKEDFKYSYNPTRQVNEWIDWNTRFDENGEISNRFFAKGDGNNLVEQKMVNNFQTEIAIPQLLGIETQDGNKIAKVSWSDKYLPILEFDAFGTQALRKVKFRNSISEKYLVANFLQNGELNQIVNLSGKRIEEPILDSIALKIAEQFNPNWKNEATISNTANNGNGTYKWLYKDGAPFFQISFKDSLPQGNWIVYNPFNQDTLQFAQFAKGLPIGNWVTKTINGVPDRRVSYHSNHKEHEIYEYSIHGQLLNYDQRDSTGNQIRVLKHYENGQLQSEQNILINSYINLNEQGDTTSYNLLYVDKDSIRIEKKMYAHNQLKSLRYNNLSTGLGYVEYYFENGKIQYHVQLKNFKNDGEYKRFDENDNLLTHGFYLEGKRHGKWTNYQYDNGSVKTEINFFENDELIIQPNEADDKACKCYDKSLAYSKIGFAPGLYDLASFRSIKPYIPKNIIPIDDWDFSKIFYVGLRTNGDKFGGNTSLRALPIKQFAFYYPYTNQLKIELLPCPTEGYLNNIEVNVHYDHIDKKITYAHLVTKRIAIGLTNNPLTNANTGAAYTAFFDSKGLYIDENGIKKIDFEKERNDCFPQGSINNFMNVDIKMAEIIITKQDNWQTQDLPTKISRQKSFYGFDISQARVTFDFVTDNKTMPIVAEASRILAGGNFVAATIKIAGNIKDEKFLHISSKSDLINIDQLEQFLIKNGCAQIKRKVDENGLEIQFYTEK